MNLYFPVSRLRPGGSEATHRLLSLCFQAEVAAVREKDISTPERCVQKEVTRSAKGSFNNFKSLKRRVSAEVVKINLCLCYLSGKHAVKLLFRRSYWLLAEVVRVDPWIIF